MTYIYTIEVYGQGFGEEYNYTYEKCFSSYKLARNYLLANFNVQGANEEEYFTLKDGHEYSTQFDYGDSAMIKKLLLMD